MTAPVEVLAAAADYTRRGWRVVAIPPRSKAPKAPGWQKLRLDEAELPAAFAGAGNVGIILGEPSGGLVDVDLDCPEAVAAAPAVLPPTGLVHGRAGNLSSHRWFVATGATTERHKDTDGATLVELRSTGGQTVAPPSTHPSGDVLAWEATGAPAPVDAAALRTAVARLAAVAILARHWPAPGARNEAALALAGLLLRGGTAEADAVAFVAAVALAAGDDEPGKRASVVPDTAAKLAAGAPVTGGPKLAELLTGDGPKVLGRVRE